MVALQDVASGLLHDQGPIEAVDLDALGDHVHVADVWIPRMRLEVRDGDEDGHPVQDAHGGCSQGKSPPAQGKRKLPSKCGEQERNAYHRSVFRVRPDYSQIRRTASER